MASTATTAPQAPEISGGLNLDYLSAALERAGQPVPKGSFEIENLLGGRTGATVQRLVVGEQSYVLKFVRIDSWRIEGMGIKKGGEPLLWLHGITRDLPGIVQCPVLDVAFEKGAGRYWVLMEDVGEGIRERGQFTHADSRSLFLGLAEMHAVHYQSDVLDSAPLPQVSGPTRMFSTPVLQLSGRQQSDEPWLKNMIEDFQVVGAFLPLFLEILGPQLADAYLDLVADRRWYDFMEQSPATLLQGDLRRANIAFEPGRIVIFDWEFAAKGPPGCDLQWHCFLHFWGYPPDGVEPGADCDELRDEYADKLESELGRRIDRNAFLDGWNLGWIKVMAQLGYTLIDPIYPDGGTAEARKSIRQLCVRAVQRALDMRESLA